MATIDPSDLLVIEPSTILAAQHCAAKDDTRSNLCGVYLAEGFAVATNGHMLVKVAQVSPKAPIIIATKDLLSAKKIATKNGLVYFEEATNSLLAVSTAHEVLGSVPLTEVHGKFPDYEQVVPKPKKGEPRVSFSFNADYIKAIGEVARSMTEGGKPCMTIEFDPFDSELAPCIVRFGKDDAFGVVMPVRADGNRMDKKDREDWELGRKSRPQREKDTAAGIKAAKQPEQQEGKPAKKPAKAPTPIKDPVGVDELAARRKAAGAKAAATRKARLAAAAA